MKKRTPTSKQRDLCKVLKPFENKWVALSPDYRRVVASGESLDEVESQLDQNQVHEVIHFRVPPRDAVFVPTAV